MIKTMTSLILLKTNSFLLRMNRDDNLNWFHGKISRDAAEQLLKKENEDGVFLVRDSNTSPGDYVLSVLHEGEVVHYQIRRHGDDAFFSIEEHTTVHGLDTLIQHYQGDSNGLVTRLAVVCPGNPPPHNSRTYGQSNLLHRATEVGNYTVVSKMLDCGYHSRDAKNQDGQTAVHLATRSGKDDILSKLIQSGANVNCRDTAGYTPLHYACQSNFPSTVRLLVVDGGANVQIRHAQTGKVPLHEAAQRGNIESVKVLLDLCAPANPRTVTNETPAELAKQYDQMECYELLKNYSPQIPKTTRAQWYHGTLNRDEAINMLLDFCKKHSITTTDGTFLVRYSDRNTGAYVLTMLCGNVPYNFIIRKEENQLFIDDGPYLESLEHLVDHYSVMSDGLPTCLQLPVPPLPKPALPEFSTMPRTKKTSPHRTKKPLTASLKHKSPRKSSLPVGDTSPPPIPPLPVDNKSIDLLTRNLSFSTDFITDPSIKSNLSGINNNTRLTPPTSSTQINDKNKNATNNNVIQSKKDVLSSPTSKLNLLGSSTLSLPPNPSDMNLGFETYDLPKNNDPVLPLVEKYSETSIDPNEQISAQDFILCSQLVMGSVLGEGEFGSVLRGTYTPPSSAPIPVAIKTLHTQHVETNSQEFLREAKVMIGLNHACIVRLIGICQTPQLAMVQELAPLGSLLNFLLENPEQATPGYELKLWACQVACGMKFLEECRFVHRDLATRNILLADRHQAKISDFGLSRALSTDSSYYKASQGGKWPIKWYAPESYNFGSFSHKSDVWSFGVTLWEMYSYGQQPYGDKRGVDAIEIIEKGERLTRPSDCPEEIYSVMRDCWAYNPQERPTFGQLVEIFSSHPEYMNISQLVLKTGS